MGYYTWFELEAKPMTQGLLEITEDGDNWPLSDLLKGQRVNDKWYQCNEEMLKLSTRHPDSLFTLKGEGEDGASDTWITYYKNGKMQHERAIVTYPEFDEAKLK